MTARIVNDCPHCHGVMETVTPRGLAPFRRCKSCGRGDRAVAAPTTAPALVRSDDGASVGSPCKVEGCPGVVVAGHCACCEKRAKWTAENMPKRECEICGGQIDGSRNRKYCTACGPLVNRLQVASHKASTKAKAKA